VFVAAVLSTALNSCNSDAFGKQLPPYRYKLTAHVETPEGIKIGSSVIEVRWKTPPKIFGSQASGSHQVRGEAVAVDLPRGQTLFILLRSEGNSEWVTLQPGYYRLNLPPKAQDRTIHAVPRTRIISGQAVDNYPIFIRFKNIHDSSSGEIVNPDNLAATFGRGVRLRALTTELTEEQPVAEIANRLPWLENIEKSFYRKTEDPSTGRSIYVPDDWRIQQLSRRDFSREGI
jgi:hypothetical protein